MQKPSHYVIAFFGIFVGLYALYSAAEPLLPAYYAALAQSVCWLFGWFDPLVTCEQNYILYEGARELAVVEGCDGVTFVVLIMAAVLPFPASWRAKLVGMTWLVLAVLAINWVRLVALTAIKFYAPAGFTLFHVYLFQPVMIAITLLIFLVWVMAPSDRANEA